MSLKSPSACVRIVGRVVVAGEYPTVKIFLMSDDCRLIEITGADRRLEKMRGKEVTIKGTLTLLGDYPSVRAIA